MPDSPLDGIAWPRRTARLAIRPATFDDLAELGRIQSLPEVAYWLPYAAGTQADYLLRMGAEGLFPRTLVVQLEGRIIGDLYLHLASGWAQVEVAEAALDTEAEIGWSVDPAYQCRGYATEAAAELVRLCFEDLGVRRITATAFAGNEASLRIMHRLGMRCEIRAVRSTLHRERGWVDTTVHALLADEAEKRGTAGAPR